MKMMKRVGVCVVVALMVAGVVDEGVARQPNVVVILADDQGWGDLSVSGNTNLSTPHIDSLAREGVTLSSFYVCQVCAPTRAEFLTGRYYPRTGVSGVSSGDERLNVDEVTVADVFKGAGYATGAFGKWHNGTQPPYHPNDRGFDEYYGFTSGHWGHYFSPPLDHNGARVRGDGFVVDDFTNRAISFIEANREKPFFCYLPLNTPHSPMMVPDAYYAKFDGAELGMRHRDEEKEDVMMTRAALALCENIDWNVGRVLAKLDDLGLAEDTIVVYFSDNGPNSFRWNGDMKGKKGAIDEGGLRAPFFMRWPGQLKGGRVVGTIAGAIDLAPTLWDLAGIGLEGRGAGAKPLDGRSLKGLLTGDGKRWDERVLFAVKDDSVSVRSQRFRLDAQGALFDIEADGGQRVDVAGEYPKVTRDLKALAKRHGAEMGEAFGANEDRPFTVGYGKKTWLMARDGTPHGGVERSVKSPNNSFFKNWGDEGGSITWPIEVGASGEYEAIVRYTCAAGNEGCVIRLSVGDGVGGGKVRGMVSEVHDPPLYDKSKERVAESHYFVKDFKPLSLGVMRLKKGRGVLTLDAVKVPGAGVIDVHSVQLNLRRAPE